MKDAENKFISFLEERGVLEEYKASFKKFRTRFGLDKPLEVWLKSVGPRYYVEYAFSWIYIGNEKKWRDLSIEWEDIVSCLEHENFFPVNQRGD